MKYIIHKKDVKVSDAIDEYVEEKLSKLSKYFNKPEEINITISIKKKGIKDAIEVTIPMKNAILRAEESNKDIKTAVDKVLDKLEMQIKKHNAKTRGKRTKIEQFSEFELEEEIPIGKIVKRKGIYSKPMNEEEAILQMELLDHDFYVFFNSEINNYSVVYRRSEGNYGILDIK